MKRIVLLSCLALLAFGGLRCVVAARNAAVARRADHPPAAGGPVATPVPALIGFNGGDFADGGRSPFGQ